MVTISLSGIQFFYIKTYNIKGELIEIINRDVYKLRTKEIKFVEVQWKYRPVKEATWETQKTCEKSIALVNVFRYYFALS